MNFLANTTTYNQLMAAAEAHSLGQLLKCIQKKVCSNQHTGLGQMSYLLYHKIFFSSLLVPYYKIENIFQYIRKKDKIGLGCLVQYGLSSLHICKIFSCSYQGTNRELENILIRQLAKACMLIRVHFFFRTNFQNSMFLTLIQQP